MPAQLFDIRIGLLVLAWLIYFGLHSLLASLWLKQWRDGSMSAEDQEGFHLSPLHRYVRHP